VVHVDDLVDVVVLQDDILVQDQRLCAGKVDDVARHAEVAVVALVAMAQRMPVETHRADGAVLAFQLDVGDVMAGARVRHGGAGTLGLDAEDAVFQALAGRVEDQRNLALRIGDQGVVIVPGRHPELCIRVIAIEPVVPLFVVQQAAFAVQEVGDQLRCDRRHVCSPCAARAFFMTSSQ